MTAKRYLQDPEHVPACRGVFERTMGIPCSHTLMTLIQEDGVVTRDMFHKHRHLATRRELARTIPIPSNSIATAAPTSQPPNPVETVPLPFESLGLENIDMVDLPASAAAFSSTGPGTAWNPVTLPNDDEFELLSIRNPPLAPHKKITLIPLLRAGFAPYFATPARLNLSVREVKPRRQPSKFTHIGPLGLWLDVFRP